MAILVGQEIGKSKKKEFSGEIAYILTISQKIHAIKNL